MDDELELEPIQEEIDQLLEGLIEDIQLEDLPFQWGDGEIEDDVPNDTKPDGGLVIRLKKTPAVKAKYMNAQEMARAIALHEGCRFFALVKGTFVFGDLIEALIEQHKLDAEEVWLATLGMNENNVDSVINLMRMFGAKKVNLLVSSYFVGVERHNMVQYLIEESAGLPITIAAAGTHAKIALIKANGMHLVLHGSANLSSNQSIEQFSLEDDGELYQWNVDWLQRVFARHTIIEGVTQRQALGNARKSWHNHLWETIESEEEEEEDEEG